MTQTKESDENELYDISARTLLQGLKTSQILKHNEILKQQGRALDEDLLKDNGSDSFREAQSRSYIMFQIQVWI